ncbi:MAG: 5-formyltetrahydrofolate cyclo-ligase [Thauera sp.]|jgi:5,10-methenyltetrahydrofolate synthetase
MDPTVSTWRRDTRNRLREARAALSPAQRRDVAARLAVHLDALLARRHGSLSGLIVSVYWPINTEPNLRDWMASLHARGATVALPLVETQRAPLVFRVWTPETHMVRGFWNIPVPPPDAPEVRPDVTIAPVMGWDPAGYRLGYGGGYFDRTLAMLGEQVFSIGTGLQSARLDTIFPQAHDIRLSAIVTEDGEQFPPRA